MAVRKFRSVDEMRRGQRISADDPLLPDIIQTVWQWAWEMSERYPPPRGVFKFRSIDEANAHREAWEKERIALIQQRMKRSQPDPPKVA
jgi:hypothetical protein